MQKPTTTILLIEDDEEDKILLQKMLLKIPYASYTMLWESSYAHGLTQMLTGGHDICLLDYRLGAQNGIELVKEARKQGYTAPIILLTGMNEGELDIQALQAGADDYIAKGQMQSELLQRIIRYAIERRKAEREREKLLREQIASRELEQRKNEFIGMVTHELKTPLTSLKGYTQLLHRRSLKTADGQTQHLTKRMESQINKLTDLIGDFLDVTRMEGGKLQFHENAYAFDELVDEIIDDIQPTTEQHKLVRQGQTQQIIWGDRMRTGQVITNLLTNAIKYAPETECITVTISADTESVMLCVQDAGPGIPPELQPHIFEPFYRIERPTQKAVSGLGLGLYIAAEMIKRQGGKIWVESAQDQGAQFSFTLPINANEREAV